MLKYKNMPIFYGNIYIAYIYTYDLYQFKINFYKSKKCRPRHAPDMSKKCAIHVLDLLKICPRYAPNLSKICPRYFLNISQI